MRILDFHVHHDGDPDDAGRFADAWSAAGIEQAVVFAMTRGDGSHASPAEIAALAARRPDFFIPFGYAAPGHHDGVAQVREAASRGFKGMKFIFPARPYDVDEYLPIYEEAAKTGMVCLFHTGIVIGTARGDHDCAYQRRWRVSSDYMRPSRLDRIARCFPEMNIVGAHLGGGAWYEEAAQLMVWNGNVYFDLSIGQMHYVRRDLPEDSERRAVKPRIQELYDAGQLKLDRVLFGTDANVGHGRSTPDWALRTVRFELDALGVGEKEKQAVWRGTAARLLHLE